MGSIDRHGKVTDRRDPGQEPQVEPEGAEAPDIGEEGEGSGEGEDAGEPADPRTGTGASAGLNATIQTVEAPKLNASREDWLEFARAAGFDPAEDASRDDLIALTGHGT